MSDSDKQQTPCSGPKRPPCYVCHGAGSISLYVSDVGGFRNHRFSACPVCLDAANDRAGAEKMIDEIRRVGSGADLLLSKVYEGLCANDTARHERAI